MFVCFYILKIWSSNLAFYIFLLSCYVKNNIEKYLKAFLLLKVLHNMSIMFNIYILFLLHNDVSEGYYIFYYRFGKINHVFIFLIIQNYLYDTLLIITKT